MTLPALAPGKRFTLPRPVGSADAVLLARLAQRDKAAGRMTAIIAADAADAQRLMDEMVFFAPELRCTVFPDWETLPYDTFSPHQDLISERLATLWRTNRSSSAHGRNHRVRTPADCGTGRTRRYRCGSRRLAQACLGMHATIDRKKTREEKSCLRGEACFICVKQYDRQASFMIIWVAGVSPR